MGKVLDEAKLGELYKAIIADNATLEPSDHYLLDNAASTEKDASAHDVIAWLVSKACEIESDKDEALHKLSAVKFISGTTRMNFFSYITKEVADEQQRFELMNAFTEDTWVSVGNFLILYGIANDLEKLECFLRISSSYAILNSICNTFSLKIEQDKSSRVMKNVLTSQGIERILLVLAHRTYQPVSAVERDVVSAEISKNQQLSPEDRAKILGVYDTKYNILQELRKFRLYCLQGVDESLVPEEWRENGLRRNEVMELFKSERPEAFVASFYDLIGIGMDQNAFGPFLKASKTVPDDLLDQFICRRQWKLCSVLLERDDAVKFVMSRDEKGNTVLYTLCLKILNSNIGASEKQEIHGVFAKLWIIDNNKTLINAQNKQGDTILHLLSDISYVFQQDVIRQLIAAGADISTLNLKGANALHSTLLGKYFFEQQIMMKILQEFIKGDADKVKTSLNAKYNGNTVLHLVLKGRFYDEELKIKIIKKLIAAGSDLTIANRNGKNAAYIISRDRVLSNKFPNIKDLGTNIDASVIDKNGETELHKIATNLSWSGRDESANLDKALAKAEIKKAVNYANDNDNNTALHIIVKEPFYVNSDARIAAIKKLIQAEADISVINSNEDTVLHLVCGDSRKTAKVLDGLLKGKNAEQAVNTKDSRGRTPLHIIMDEYFSDKSEKADAIKKLIQAGADISIPDADGKTPLYLVCTNNSCDKAMLNELLKSEKVQDGINLNFQGDTILHTVLGASNLRYEHKKEFLEALIAAGADVNIPDKNGKTVLEINRELVEDAMKPQVNPAPAANVTNTASGQDLHKMINGINYFNKSEKLKSIEQAIEKGADVSVEDNQGRTPIHLICNDSNKLDLLDLLLKGENAALAINKKDKNGETVLHKLARVSSYSFSDGEKNATYIAKVVAAGADISITDKNGCTPMHLVCSKNLKSLDRLLESENVSAAINIQENGKKNTILHTLIESSYYVDKQKMIKALSNLVEARADVSLINKDGCTSLHLICKNYSFLEAGSLEILLKGNKAKESLDIKYDGDTALVMVLKSFLDNTTKIKCAKALIEAGSSVSIPGRYLDTALDIIKRDRVLLEGLKEVLPDTTIPNEGNANKNINTYTNPAQEPYADFSLSERKVTEDKGDITKLVDLIVDMVVQNKHVYTTMFSSMSVFKENLTKILSKAGESKEVADIYEKIVKNPTDSQNKELLKELSQDLYRDGAAFRKMSSNVFYRFLQNVYNLFGAIYNLDSSIFWKGSIELFNDNLNPEVKELFLEKIRAKARGGNDKQI